MGVRKLSTASIKTNNKSTKFWDGNVGTYESIATVFVTSDIETISFTNIPSTYTHLQIRLIAKTTSSGDGIRVRFNSDSGSNYSAHLFYGTAGGSTGASAYSTQTIGFCGNATYSGSQADTFSINILDIPEYANTNKYKTLMGLAGYDLNNSGEVRFVSTLWQSTAAINAITFYVASGTNYFKTNSRFALYGIRGV